MVTEGVDRADAWRAIHRAFVIPLRPLRGAVRVTRVTPAVESILCAAESRRAWEHDVAAWAARERRLVSNAGCTAARRASARARRAAAGLCGGCGRLPRAEGRSVCDGCRVRLAASQVRRESDRVDRGLCARCGLHPLVTKTRCTECRS
jgi:hypothetical protein